MFSTHTEMTKLGAFQIYRGNCFVIILLRHTRFNIWNLCSYFSTSDKYVSALKWRGDGSQAMELFFIPYTAAYTPQYAAITKSHTWHVNRKLPSLPNIPNFNTRRKFKEHPKMQMSCDKVKKDRWVLFMWTAQFLQIFVVGEEWPKWFFFTD